MTSAELKGRCRVFGDNVNTDEIIPAKFLVTTDPAELSAHCMDGIRPGFPLEIRPGDIIVAGENFGCGSSREHAPLAIKGAGISCVVAKSFARIFFRNAINIGLPIVECPGAVAAVREGDELAVDLSGGKVQKLAEGTSFDVAPFPEFLRRIIDAGGLMNIVRQRLKAQAKEEMPKR